MGAETHGDISRSLDSAGLEAVTIAEMRPSPPPRPSLLQLLGVVAIALGTCLAAGAVMATRLMGISNGFPFVIGGVVLLVAGLIVVWVVTRQRDRSLW
jgi:hypothetical protein